MFVENIDIYTSVLDTINNGVIILEEGYHIVFWNKFMAKHSGYSLKNVFGKNIFNVFPDLPEAWMKLKIRSIKLIENFSFISWKQRPYLFKFRHNNHSSGLAGPYMNQDCTFIPINDRSTGKFYICIIIQDMTDSASMEIKLREMQDINKSLEKISNVDALTSIYNRGFIEEKLDKQFKHSFEEKENLCTAIFDIDHFKLVNDTYGHLAGDEVLKNISSTILTILPKHIHFGRYGGEEFLLIFSNTDKKEAIDLSEEIRLSMDNLVTDFKEKKIKVTISIGLSWFNRTQKNYLQMIHEADIALYDSKRNGRNRLTIFGANHPD